MPRPKLSKVARSPEVRAAVIAALLAGQSVSQVAKDYKLPKGTVSSWKKRTAAPVAASAASVAGVASNTATQKEKGESIEDLLFTLLRENLKGLIAGAALLQDMTWLRTQTAAELGTIFGITHDKTTRMLEALGGTQDAAA